MVEIYRDRGATWKKRERKQEKFSREYENGSKFLKDTIFSRRVNPGKTPLALHPRSHASLGQQRRY